MADKKKQSALSAFLSSTKEHPVLAAIAAGLYPVLFYFTNNYTLINTWEHLGYFVLVFLIIPIIGFVIASKLFNLSFLKKWKKYIVPFLGVFVFLFLLKVCLYAGIQKKMIAGILVIAGLFAFFLYKHFKKVMVLQLLLATIGLVTLIPTVISQLNFSKEWLKQPDAIEDVVFQKKPNVYFIQPDGYVNFSELKNGYYKIENSVFENFIAESGFKHYPDFRSNYGSTLTSNSATFMMKHHHYNNGSNFSEAIDARNVIISDNTVLNAFKNNGYKTHFLTEKPYLLLNRPKMGFDYCNIDYKDVAYIGTGLGEARDLFAPLKLSIEMDPETPKFYFVEIFNPGHIHGRQADSKGAEEEKNMWAESLKESNRMVTLLVNIIKERDPNGLIIIMADHGGYVGLDYTGQSYTKTEDRDLIHSMFSSELAIHWPNNEAPEIDKHFKSSVNLFRVLFAHLAQDNAYLKYLQENGSYVIIKDGAPKGVYQYLDDNGEVSFKKH